MHSKQLGSWVIKCQCYREGVLEHGKTHANAWGRAHIKSQM
jgi:hypothetical protein